MINTAHRATLDPCEFVTVFDFEKQTTSPNSYNYWPDYPDFTFLINLTQNDITAVSDVTLYVYCSNGVIRKIPAVFDEKQNCFVATGAFTSYSLPENVGVYMNTKIIAKADRKQMNEKIEAIDIKKKELQIISDSISKIHEEIEYIRVISEQENSKLATLQNQIDEATQNNQSTAKLISEYLTILGYPCSEDDLAIEVPEYSSERFDSLMNETNILQNSDTGISTLISEAQTLVSDTEKILDISSWGVDEKELLNNNVSDTIYFENDGVKMMYYEVDYSSVDLANMDEENMITLSMTEGNPMTAYIEDGNYLIIDHQNQKGWIVEKVNTDRSRSNTRNVIRKSPKYDFDSLLSDLRSVISTITSWVDTHSRDAIQNIATLEEGIRNQKNWLAIAEARGENVAKDLKKIEAQLEYFDNWAHVGGLTKIEARRYAQLLEEQKELLAKRAELLEETRTLNREIKQCKSWIGELTTKHVLTKAIYGQIMDVLDLLQGVYTLIDYGVKASQDGRKWDKLIDDIRSKQSSLKCPSQNETAELVERAKNLEKKANNDKDGIIRRYWLAWGMSGSATGITLTFMINRTVGVFLRYVSPFITGLLDHFSTSIFKEAEADSRNAYNDCSKEKEKLKCKGGGDDENNNDDNSNNNNGYGNDGRKGGGRGTKGKNDPSGYVYEAVPTNRIEDVTATIYEQEQSTTPWDAANFSEVNPQITDETGLYQWNVPQGMWQVRFEKPGYETTQTDWLPVPPPQLEINIPMSQAVAPMVLKARGMESGITLDFSKYMQPATLEKSGRVSVMVNGKNANGYVEMLNLEEDPYHHKEYASKVKFVPNKAFKTTDEVVITVKKEVESYASKQMEADFVQLVKIEPEVEGFKCDSLFVVDYQTDRAMEIAVLPAASVKGRTVNISSTSSMIATVDKQSVTLNDEGKATITVNGNLPGSSSLHLQLDDTDIEKYVAVNVVMKETMVKKPKASKPNGSIVNPDYLLSLTCNTSGATIYYTLDGSCPCDEQKRIKYSGPFALPIGEVTLKAVAVREGMDDSDIVTYEYIVKVDDPDGLKEIKESHDFEASYQDGSIIVSGAKGAHCHIYDLQGHELASQSILGNQTRINVPNTDVYVISISFSKEQTVVRKVMRKL